MITDDFWDAVAAERARELRVTRPEAEYYLVTAGMDRRGVEYWEVYSGWAGRSGRHPRWEIRKGRVMRGDAEVPWDAEGESWVAVHDIAELGDFLLIGGKVLIERGFAEEYLPEAVGPAECVRDPDGGFFHTGDLPDISATRRGAVNQLRVQVVSREGGRCAECGRSFADAAVRLEAHHLIPWRDGGPTAFQNLVALCAECHRGVSDDSRSRLRRKLGLPDPATDREPSEKAADVRRFTRAMRDALTTSTT